MNKELEMLEQFLVENQDVLIRLKNAKPEDYTAEKFFNENLKKTT